jgi:hypothetical protein
VWTLWQIRHDSKLQIKEIRMFRRSSASVLPLQISKTPPLEQSQIVPYRWVHPDQEQ